MAGFHRPTQDQRNTMVRKTLVLPIAGTLSAATDQARVVMPEAGEIVEVSVSVLTAPTGATAIFDVHVGGTTIYTTQGNRPTIAVSANDSTEAAAPEAGGFVEDSVVTVDVDQVGSTVAGADAFVAITYIARAAHKS